MQWTRTKIIAALAATAVLVAGVATGRHLLAGGSTTPSAAMSAAATGHGASGTSPSASSAASAVARAGVRALRPSAASKEALSSPSATASGTGSTLPDVPVSAVTPQVVHTATIDMRVGEGKLAPTLRSVATVAGDDGGYVDSSSLSGGTARRSPVAGTIVIRVVDSDFADAITEVAALGTVEDQSIKGRDVTIAEAQNAASLTVLQDEVTLLENKLAGATDISTFLQIQGQLFPVEKQLQQLQSAQAVLENSASMATITVSMSAPGAPVPAVMSTPAPRTHAAAAATVAWRYLRHNSLAVLDGLAVGLGWALPVSLPLALVGLIAFRVIRRRRQAVTPA